MHRNLVHCGINYRRLFVFRSLNFVSIERHFLFIRVCFHWKNLFVFYWKIRFFFSFNGLSLHWKVVFFFIFPFVFHLLKSISIENSFFFHLSLFLMKNVFFFLLESSSIRFSFIKVYFNWKLVFRSLRFVSMERLAGICY